jgi:glucosamine kinase
MMYLIADSGATKTAWRLVDDTGRIVQATTAGLSPYYQTQAQIEAELRTALLPALQLPEPEAAQQMQAIYFYGTGCARIDKASIVTAALRQVFPASNCRVYPDMLGAARALCGTEPGIACILGTGSNAALYDGQWLTSTAASLGFWLGDEGSGGHIGKQLVADYLNHDLPDLLRDQFERRFNPSFGEIMDRVYSQSFPNRYLASFAKFVFDHLREPYCYQLAYQSFGAFFDKRVCKFPNYQNHPVSFTGSIAFYYANVLRQVAADRGIIVRNIVEEPVAGLVLYHRATGELP